MVPQMVPVPIPVPVPRAHSGRPSEPCDSVCVKSDVREDDDVDKMMHQLPLTHKCGGVKATRLFPQPCIKLDRVIESMFTSEEYVYRGHTRLPAARATLGSPCVAKLYQ